MIRENNKGVLSVSLNTMNNNGSYSNIISGTIKVSLPIRYIKIFLDNISIQTLLKTPFEFTIDTKKIINGKHNLKIITIWKSGIMTSNTNIINIYNEKILQLNKLESGSFLKNIPVIWKFNIVDTNIQNLNINCYDKNNEKKNINIKTIRTRMLQNFKMSVLSDNNIISTVNGNSDLNILINNPVPNTYYINLVSDTPGDYNIIINADYLQNNTNDNEDNNNVPNQTQNKYGVVVGISDYMYINDLEYCDEDAVSWCNYLKNYNLTLLGDLTSSYEPYKPLLGATEKNIRDTINNYLNYVKENDTFVLITSGHGSGDGKGYSWICCLDESGNPNGEYDCNEMAKDLKQFTDKGVYVFVFCDNCYSGGLIDAILNTCDKNKIFIATTCSKNGYGFDSSQYKHGLWTYTFLVETLMADEHIKTLGEAFTHAVAMYPYDGNNKPQCGGNPKIMI